MTAAAIHLFLCLYIVKFVPFICMGYKTFQVFIIYLHPMFCFSTWFVYTPRSHLYTTLHLPSCSHLFSFIFIFLIHQSPLTFFPLHLSMYSRPTTFCNYIQKKKTIWKLVNWYLWRALLRWVFTEIGAVCFLPAQRQTFRLCLCSMGTLLSLKQYIPFHCSPEILQRFTINKLSWGA